MTNSTSIHTKLRYVSSPCGSGKTTALCNMINKELHIQGSAEKFIIVQNTQKLANQTAKDIDNCEVIISTSKNRKKNVINSVLGFLKHPTKRALIITDKTFFRIPVELLQGWQIWLDDVTNFHSYKCINDSSSWVKGIIYNELMQEHEIVDGGTGKYLTAKKKNVKGDILYKISKELSVIGENDIFIMNNDYFNEPDKVQLNILGWIDLNKYIGLPITFMGANFENSLIYKANLSLFEKADLEGLLTRRTPLNERLKVYYFSNKKKLSKGWKDNNYEKLNNVYDYLDAELKGQGFYWTNNEKDKHKLQQGTRISPDARGHNDYKDRHTCVWLACMRPDDTEAKLCELLLKITGEDIHQAREYESLHQFALRGISRQFDSTETQIVYVFDKWQAESLSTNIEHIPGVLENVTQGVPGRPPGAKNVNKLPELSDTKSRRFNRWKTANPGLEIALFHEFLNSNTNRDLSTDEKAAMLVRYDKAVQKKPQMQSETPT
ncbi:DEAD/DEAH box helicase family protein [Cronobacter malonaticus]|uniref:DEAD/DEAH box helicase family protein n=1 Tax=Cronobacter malonaticus TaxID=413503 RepID=UPI001A313EC4|nr:DEAD/DEAH box helicase family protein [Cronobacter malonaticus]MDI6459375.1 DEAD/DEAH box helicase family protein [Cronobacter malonaticus]HAU5429411.1 type III restriction endonuclease subunit R [Cronobacter malonaticus]